MTPETSIQKQLVDKMYEKRKAAALELEKYLSPFALSGRQNRNRHISFSGRYENARRKATSRRYQ